MSDFNEKKDISLDSILDGAEGTSKSKQEGTYSPNTNDDAFESPVSKHDDESPFEDKSFEDHRLGQILDHPPGAVKLKHLESKIRSFLENIVQGEGKAHALEPMKFPSIQVSESILGGLFYINDKTKVSEDITITDTNVMSVGPIEIEDGITVTLEGEWTIV